MNANRKTGKLNYRDLTRPKIQPLRLIFLQPIMEIYKKIGI